MYFKKIKTLLFPILLTVTLMPTYSFFYARASLNELALSDDLLTDEDTSGKTIVLSESGTYVLIGPDQDNTIDDDNVVVVDPNDIILISESGDYNLIFQNVNVDVSDIENSCAFTVPNDLHANVVLTLVGENALKGSRNGISVGSGSNLTITGLKSIDSLYVYGGSNGIKLSRELTIKNGQIIVSGNKNGIYGNKVTIENGDVRIHAFDKESYGIDADDLIINNGDIEISGNRNGICVSRLKINKGKVNVSSKKGFGIFGSINVEINGGDITSNTNETSVYQDEYTSFDIKGGTFNGTNAIEFFKQLLAPPISPNIEPSLNK